MAGELPLDRNESKVESHSSGECAEQDSTANNILNWPENRLRRKTSIGELEHFARAEEDQLKDKKEAKPLVFDNVGLVS